MIKLGLNIDHVATLRQVRGTRYPNVVRAALICEEAGADAITLHLREDLRHIQDADVDILRGMLQTRMNLECAVTEEMIANALRVKTDLSPYPTIRAIEQNCAALEPFRRAHPMAQSEAK